MIAAPRCCTVGMNVVLEPIRDRRRPRRAGLPPTSAWKTSGYCVAEWLPQIVIFVMSLTVLPVFAASWADGAVVVEPGHRREAAWFEMPGALFMRDEAVRVGRVADHEHLRIVVGRAVVSALPCGCEDGAVRLEQVRPLHALLAGHGADEQRDVDAPERLVGSSVCTIAVEQRERAVLELHAHASQRIRGRE